MIRVNADEFRNYSDKNGNVIICDDKFKSNSSKVTFYGKNNSVVIGRNTRLIVDFQFQGDNSHFVIGDNCSFTGKVLVGGGCKVNIGDNFACAGHVYITAAEETEVTIGNGCRFNANIQIRTHDMHPIYDLETHQRLNKSKSIHIGDKVWFGAYVSILKGVTIGNNSVVGLNSTVTKSIPDHCLAAGIPVEIKREKIDWDTVSLTIRPYPEYSGSAKIERNEKGSIGKFIQKHPQLFILFKWRDIGLKNTLINFKGYHEIKKRKMFDADFYLAHHKDVRKSGMDPLIHYLYYGYKEERKPCQDFDGKNYMRRNADVKNSNLNPLVHYVLYGMKEGRKIG